MQNYEKVGSFQVASELYQFINTEALPDSGVEQQQFWTDFEALVKEFAPENKALLAERDALQQKIDDWYRKNSGAFEFAQYKSFLTEIGYLEPEPEDFQITTDQVDVEFSSQAGPQLVVPVNNARYAINAANARWEAYMMPFTALMRFPKRAGQSAVRDTIRSVAKRLFPFRKIFLIKRFLWKTALIMR